MKNFEKYFNENNEFEEDFEEHVDDWKDDIFEMIEPFKSAIISEIKKEIVKYEIDNDDFGNYNSQFRVVIGLLSRLQLGDIIENLINTDNYNIYEHTRLHEHFMLNYKHDGDIYRIPLIFGKSDNEDDPDGEYEKRISYSIWFNRNVLYKVKQ